MTPAARIAAAIEILDDVLGGAAAEKTLTTWARRSRFAGSGDRHAIRDLVFDAIRRKRSYAWLGGAETGRALMIGALRHAGVDPADHFTGVGHAPNPLNDEEQVAPDIDDAPEPVRLDLPEWLCPIVRDSLGDGFQDGASRLRERAKVYLRVNTLKTDSASAQDSLGAQDIETTPHPDVKTALEVVKNPRRVHLSKAYLDGWVELQDVSSQAVLDGLPLAARALDYCAGGGGKALALAAQGAVEIVAHDIDFGRMADIPARAERAGANIRVVDSDELQNEDAFDLVLCDAPCSGSGAWRRSPEAKWQLTPERLGELNAMQRDVLTQGAKMTGQNGSLVYVTCSVLRCENEDIVAEFLAANADWECRETKQYDLSLGGDGFFRAIFRRNG